MILSFCVNGPRTCRVYVKTYGSGLQFKILFELHDIFDGVNKFPDNNYWLEDSI